MEEQETVLRDGFFVRQSRNYPIEERFLFFYHYLTGQKFDKSGIVWSRFKEAKKKRDTWTHPKPPFQTSGLQICDAQHAIEAVCGLLCALVDPPYSWMKPPSEVRERIIDELEG